MTDTAPFAQMSRALAAGEARMHSPPIQRYGVTQQGVSPRTMNRERAAIVLLIEQKYPPRPPCFERDADWVRWLQDAHLSGVHVLRRLELQRGVKGARFRVLDTKQIPYCDDCHGPHKARMRRVGRCDPSDVRME